MRSKVTSAKPVSPVAMTASSGGWAPAVPCRSGAKRAFGPCPDPTVLRQRAAGDVAAARVVRLVLSRGELVLARGRGIVLTRGEVLTLAVGAGIGLQSAWVVQRIGDVGIGDGHEGRIPH